MFSCLDLVPDVFDRERPDAMLCGGSIIYLFDCIRVRMFKKRRRGFLIYPCFTFTFYSPFGFPFFFPFILHLCFTFIVKFVVDHLSNAYSSTSNPDDCQLYKFSALKSFQGLGTALRSTASTGQNLLLWIGTSPIHQTGHMTERAHVSYTRLTD